MQFKYQTPSNVSVIPVRFLGPVSDTAVHTINDVTFEFVRRAARELQAQVDSNDVIWWTVPENIGDLALDYTSAWGLIGTWSLGEPGVVGDDTNPFFKFVIKNAGVDRAELAIYCKSDEHPTWMKVWGQEMTGTAAAVRNGLLGSMVEGFRRDGAQKPTFRFNSYPWPGLEIMANGGQAPIGNMTRSGGVVTVFVEDSAGNPIPHGFGVGQTIYDPADEANFAAGSKVIASVPGFDNFTYSEAGSSGTNTIVHDFTAEFDVRTGRGGFKEWHLEVGGQLVVISYPDAFVVQAGTRLVAAGGLDMWSHDGSGTTGDQTINNPSGLFKVAAGQQSVTITCDKVHPTSKVFCVLQSDDATMTSVKCVTVTEGSFTFKGNAVCTADTKVAFQLLGSVDV